MAHMQPLPKQAHPELADTFATFELILGFVPNSLLTMQRKPKIVAGFEMHDPGGRGSGRRGGPGFKRRLAHVASRAAGCQYCQAHSLVAAGLRGVGDEKLAALWDYPTNPLFSEAVCTAGSKVPMPGPSPTCLSQKSPKRDWYGYI